MCISMSGPVFNSKSTTFQGVCLLGSYSGFTLKQNTRDQVLPWHLVPSPWPIQHRLKGYTPLYTEEFPAKTPVFPAKSSMLPSKTPVCKLNPDWISASVFPQKLRRQHPVHTTISTCDSTSTQVHIQ